MTKLVLEIFAIVRIPAVQSEDSIFNQLVAGLLKAADDLLIRNHRRGLCPTCHNV